MKSMLRSLYYALPVQWRYHARRLVYLPVDLFRKRHPLEPPKGMIYTGGGDFIAIGKTFFNYFKKYGALTPESQVLDIGSGIGRMAIPFTEFLNEKGRYEGFDVVKRGVDWCNKHVGSKYAHFNFQFVPLKNDLYNLDTADEAALYKFPYQDTDFDFAFLTSVFTHMMPNDLDNYLSEIHRVLKPGKICFATFFILDEVSSAHMKSGSKAFLFDKGHYTLMDEKVKEANVAYKKDFIFELANKNGFEVTEFIRGDWSGAKPDALNEHQDILILKKR